MRLYIRYIAAAAFAGLFAGTAAAAPKKAVKEGIPLSEIEMMIRHGDLDSAAAALDSASAAQPKNERIDYLRGKCFLAMNNDSAAAEAFTDANRKGSNDALLALAEIAARQYRVDDAQDNIDAYKAYIAKNRRKKLTDESAEISSQLTRTRSMLERVEQIVVFDSVTVDRDDFLSAYRLAAEAGSLRYPADVLPDATPYTDPTVVYTTEDGREMLWGLINDNGLFELRMMNQLADNTWEAPQSVGSHLGQDADANYPFLMPDGITLYFASDTGDSLGGLDIYVSRNNGEEFLQPQNIGMPYNSPYDDYMLAIDEITGVGWWASDRNRLGDKITVYKFIPASTRVNVNPDDETLASRASLRSIRSTWPDGADFSKQQAALAAIKPARHKQNARFAFALPDGRVLSDISQFSSRAAADTMSRYLQLEASTADAEKILDSLRRQFAAGDTSVSPDILSMESDIEKARKEMRRIANDVIKAEMGGQIR